MNFKLDDSWTVSKYADALNALGLPVTDKPTVREGKEEVKAQQQLAAKPVQPIDAFLEQLAMRLFVLLPSLPLVPDVPLTPLPAAGVSQFGVIQAGWIDYPFAIEFAYLLRLTMHEFGTSVYPPALKLDVKSFVATLNQLVRQFGRQVLGIPGSHACAVPTLAWTRHLAPHWADALLANFHVLRPSHLLRIGKPQQVAFVFPPASSSSSSAASLLVPESRAMPKPEEVTLEEYKRLQLDRTEDILTGEAVMIGTILICEALGMSKQTKKDFLPLLMARALQLVLTVRPRVIVPRAELKVTTGMRTTRKDAPANEQMCCLLFEQLKWSEKKIQQTVEKPEELPFDLNITRGVTVGLELARHELATAKQLVQGNLVGDDAKEMGPLGLPQYDGITRLLHKFMNALIRDHRPTLLHLTDLYFQYFQGKDERPFNPRWSFPSAATVVEQSFLIMSTCAQLPRKKVRIEQPGVKVAKRPKPEAKPEAKAKPSKPKPKAKPPPAKAVQQRVVMDYDPGDRKGDSKAKIAGLEPIVFSAASATVLATKELKRPPIPAPEQKLPDPPTAMELDLQGEELEFGDELEEMFKKGLREAEEVPLLTVDSILQRCPADDAVNEETGQYYRYFACFCC